MTGGTPGFCMGQPPRDHVVCEDNKTEGGCGCQDRGAPGRPEAQGAVVPAETVFRPAGTVAAGRQVCRRAGQRPAEAQWVDDRRACWGPVAGPDAAAAQPRCLGHLRRDGRGAPVRRGGAGGGSAPVRAPAWPGDRGAGRDRPGEAGPGHGRGAAAVTWGARAGSRTGSTPSTWPTCTSMPAMRSSAPGSGSPGPRSRIR